MMVGGIVLAVAVICDCLVFGLWLGLFSVVKLLGGRGVIGWCCHDGWWHRAGSCCNLRLLGFGLWLGLNSVVKLLGGRCVIGMVLS